MEALCGTTIRLTTLDGRPLSIPVREVATPVGEKVVPGEGMPLTKSPGSRGNLRIKFDVVFPRTLSDQQKASLRQVLAQ